MRCSKEQSFYDNIEQPMNVFTLTKYNKINNHSSFWKEERKKFKIFTFFLKPILWLMVIVVNNILYFGVVLLIRIKGNFTECLSIHKYSFYFHYLIYLKWNVYNSVVTNSMVWTTLYNNQLFTNSDIQSMIIVLRTLTLLIIYANTIT